MRPVPKAQLQWLMGNTHVGTAPVVVVRDLYRRFQRMGASGRKDRSWRRACYRHALKCHKANLDLCREFRL